MSRSRPIPIWNFGHVLATRLPLKTYIDADPRALTHPPYGCYILLPEFIRPAQAAAE